MPLIDMQDYSPAARRYWWTVVVLGVWALVYAVATRRAQLEGALAAAGARRRDGRRHRGPLPGAHPRRQDRRSRGGEIFIFLMLLLYGAPRRGARRRARGRRGLVAHAPSAGRAASARPRMASLAMLACALALRRRARAPGRSGLQQRRPGRRAVMVLAGALLGRATRSSPRPSSR